MVSYNCYCLLLLEIDRSLFIYKNGIIKTPPLSGSILGGVTRDSVCVISQKLLNIPVEESDVFIKDLKEADEVFCTGTAVVVSPIGKITFNEKTFEINKNQIGPITNQIRGSILGIQREESIDPYGWLKYL